MAKLDLAKVAAKVQTKLEKEDPRLAKKVGLGSKLHQLTDADYLIMPEWWQKATGAPGLPKGKLVQIAGKSDSGKTSAAIEAMRSAQEQGWAIIYVETEGKTTEKDLVAWGVDPDDILIVQTAVTEEAYELLFEYWDAVKDAYPDLPLLVVFDSFGNTVSKRDKTIDLNTENSQPGGKGKINRIGVNKMIAKMQEDEVAVLVINYTYDNMGSVGQTNAGGQAINFFSILTFQTSRKGWVEKTVKGKKVRIGADVQWKLYKNHLNKGGDNEKVVVLRITAEGIELREKK